VAALEFVIDKSFRPHYGPGVDSALTETSARNIFGGGGMRACKGDRWVGLTALLPSCAAYLEIGYSTSWNPQGLSRPAQYCYTYINWDILVFLEAYS